MSAVDERFQDVLLHIEIAVDDGGLFLAKFGQIVDRLVEAIVVDVVGGRFGAEIGAVANILLSEAILVM